MPLRTLFATFEDYAASFGSDRDEGGRYGFWHNPNWQWDYWRHGLRDEEDENSAFLQQRIGDGDPAQILKEWGWGFYAVVNSERKWVRADADETDGAWLARCLAFIREAPVGYWFSAVMCHA